MPTNIPEVRAVSIIRAMMYGIILGGNSSSSKKYIHITKGS
jgi:hypothetical protein